MAFDIAPIAETYRISTEELGHKIKAHGWDFSSLRDDDTAGQEFVTRWVTDYAKQLAEQKARKLAAEQQRKAQRLGFVSSEFLTEKELEQLRVENAEEQEEHQPEED